MIHCPFAGCTGEVVKGLDDRHYCSTCQRCVGVEEMAPEPTEVLVQSLRAQLDQAIACWDQATARREAAEAALARWRPVVEAALRWRKADEDPDHLDPNCDCLDDLADAVDALGLPHQMIDQLRHDVPEHHDRPDESEQGTGIERTPPR